MSDGAPVRPELDRELERELDAELDAELAFHLEAVAAALVAEGWDPDMARAEARRRFGDLDATRAYCRRMDRAWARRQRRRMWMSGWGQDLRFAVRQLRRAPGFAVAAVATLAVGIGAVTGIFALVDGVLLRPLPYDQPDRLVRIWDRSTRIEGWDRVNVNPANFRDWQERAGALEAMAGFIASEVTRGGEDGAERVPGAWITAGLLEVLGAPPALGREPTSAEDTPGDEARVVVVSHEAWTNLHGADQGVLGRTIPIEGEAFEVIGVTAPGFRLPGTQASRQPLYLMPGGFGAPNGRGGHWLRAVGRLAPGTSIDRARDEMTALAAALAAEYPDTNEGLTVVLEPLHEAEVGSTRRVLLLFLASVAMLLAVACANVAWLFLVRHLGRTREFAVRAALGAPRSRILRQLFAETLLVAGLGAAGGALLARLLIGLLPRLDAVELPRLDAVTIDLRVLGFGVTVSLVAALAAVFAPALRALGTRSSSALRSGAGSLGRDRRRLSDLLAVTEVALAVVLLLGAGLLARSYLELSGVDPGFDPEGAAVVRIVVPEATYDGAARAALYEAVLGRVRALPGVSAAGAADSPPFQRSQNSRTSYSLPDRAEEDDGSLMAWEQYATPGYFRALGIPLLAGRAFTTGDRAEAPPVAVVSRAFAEASWPEVAPVEAVGRRFRYNGQSWEVIGVVESVRRRSLDSDAEAEMFFPPGQHPFWVPNAVFLTVRSASDPGALIGPVRSVVREVASDVPVGLTATMESLLSETLAPARFRSLLVAAFAAVALALSLLGVYGILAYGVTLRRREIGVRLALGAAPASVRSGVLGRGFGLSALGLGIGLVVWLAVGGALRGLLFGVGRFDPSTLAAVAGVFLVAGSLAAYLPARRATRLDPVRVLSQDG